MRYHYAGSLATALNRIDEKIVYRILTEERGDPAELLELLLEALERLR